MVDAAEVSRLLGLVRTSRRAGDAAAINHDMEAVRAHDACMQKAADDLFRLLLGETDAQSCIGGSAIYYELGMAAWRNGHLVVSYGLHLQAERLAERGNDPIGRLFARQNIGGLILPALGRWREGIVMHKQTLARIAQHLADGLDDERLHRIQMDCWCQMVRHSVANDAGNVSEIEAWCGEIVANRIFNDDYKDTDPTKPGPAQDLKNGLSYIAKDSNKGLLER